jgi:hypothetical protein
MHPVNLIRHSLRSLVACPANVLRAIKLPLTPLSYFTFCHLWPGVSDVSICSLLDRRDECCGEYLYHLLVPHSLEGLRQANTRGVGIRSHDAMILESKDKSLLGRIGNVVFCRKYTFALEKFAHRLLRNISNDCTEN